MRSALSWMSLVERFDIPSIWVSKAEPSSRCTVELVPVILSYCHSLLFRQSPYQNEMEVEVRPMTPVAVRGVAMIEPRRKT